MTDHQFNDLIEDGHGQLFRYGGYDRWYLQDEDQDGWDFEEIEAPHTPMVLITKDEYEELKELAARYRDLNR